MFTGIVETQGTVSSREGGKLLVLPKRSFVALQIGESIAVNGVCLTVDRKAGPRPTREPSGQGGRGIQFRLLPETLRVSTLGKLRAGDSVNLERSLRAGSRLGGHLLLGHVDGRGTVVRRIRSKGSLTLEIAVPSFLIPMMVPKGPIAMDGISLTLGAVRAKENRIRVHLVSHTLAVTTLGKKPLGAQVNVEVDLIAKYLRGML